MLNLRTRIRLKRRRCIPRWKRGKKELGRRWHAPGVHKVSPTRLQPTRPMSPTQLIEMNQKDCEDGTLNRRRTKLTMPLDMSDCTIKSKAVMDSRDERVR